jgi:ketosteroid isomerase-like protein
MNGIDEFLAQMIEQHCRAATAVRNGDPTLFIEQVSKHEPVSLFPASQPSRTGYANVCEAIRRVASVYSSSEAVEFDVAAAGVSGDLAYIVGHERAASSIQGGAQEDLELRVTHVNRRESGDWKLVHRHADPGPATGGADHLRQAMRDRRDTHTT